MSDSSTANGGVRGPVHVMKGRVSPLLRHGNAPATLHMHMATKEPPAIKLCCSCYYTSSTKMLGSSMTVRMDYPVHLPLGLQPPQAADPSHTPTSISYHAFLARYHARSQATTTDSNSHAVPDTGKFDTAHTNRTGTQM